MSSAVCLIAGPITVYTAWVVQYASSCRRIYGFSGKIHASCQSQYQLLKQQGVATFLLLLELPFEICSTYFDVHVRLHSGEFEVFLSILRYLLAQREFQTLRTHQICMRLHEWGHSKEKLQMCFPFCMQLFDCK